MIGAILGGMTVALCGVPPGIETKSLKQLPKDMLDVLNRFRRTKKEKRIMHL